MKVRITRGGIFLYERVLVILFILVTTKILKGAKMMNFETAEIFSGNTTETSSTSAGTIFIGIQYKDVYKYIKITTTAYKKVIKDFLISRKNMDETEFEEYLFSSETPKEFYNTETIIEKALKIKNTKAIIIFSAFKVKLWHINKGVVTKETESTNIVPQTSLLEKALINKKLLCEDIKKETTQAIVSFVEYRRVLETTLNKFPKNEKFSTVREMKDLSSKLYDIIGTYSYTKNMNAYKIYKAFEEAYTIINRLKFSFYLAYTQNFYFRCKNEGTKNRNVTEVLDSLQNREGYVHLLGAYSLFLCNFYTMMIKAFSKLKLLPRDKAQSIISMLENKIKRYNQSNDKDKSIALLDTIEEAESSICEIKENSTRELDEVPW